MSRKLLDSLYVGALMLYVLAGMASVPFHGDESTIIYMSHDWYTLFHDPLSLGYHLDFSGDPHGATDQQLRLANGPLAGYAIGVAWSLVGLSPKDLNDQWLWGADWDYNQANGHIPTPALLFVARLSSTLATAASVAVIFALARRLANRQAAWIATFLYGMTPAILLDGRRAMFEGVFLLASAFLLLAGVWLAGRVARRIDRSRDWLGLGAAAGLALAAKHTALILIVPIFGVLFAAALNMPVLRACAPRRETGLAYLWKGMDRIRILNLALTGFMTAGIFLALNPVWWARTLEVPAAVLHWRSELLNGQAAYYGGYHSLADRAVGMGSALFGGAQYYEDTHGWPTWIGGQIVTYEAAGVAGIPTIVPIAGILAVPGALLMIRRIRELPMALFAVVVVVLTGATFFLTPLLWVRYYLPLMAPLAVLAGLSEGWLHARLA